MTAADGSISDFVKLSGKRLLGNLSARLAGRHATAVLTDTPQGRFLVGSADFTVGRRLRHSGAYGLSELGRLYDLVDADSHVLVVGAHVGTLAIPLSRKVAEVVAIEATPSTFDLLKSNVFLNESTNVEIHQAAASDSAGVLEFFVSSSNSGGNKRKPLFADRRYDFDRPKVVEVQAVRLDDLLAGRQFDLILIDIEGSEYFALRGMQTLLSNAQTLVIEFVPHHLTNVAGVGVAEFLSTIMPHFDQLEIGATGRRHDGDDIERELSAMYKAGLEDEGLIFSRRQGSSLTPN